MLKNPDEHGCIRRTDRIADTVPGISRFQQSVLHQGRIEQYFLDFIGENSNIKVEYLKRPLRLEIDKPLTEDSDAYPITVEVQSIKASHAENRPNALNGTDHVSARAIDSLGSSCDEKGEGSGPEVIRCKYMIGCDGAHSWVREQLGFVMEGDQTESVWGVMDILPITDFRKLRILYVVSSAEPLIQPISGCVVPFTAQRTVQ